VGIYIIIRASPSPGPILTASKAGAEHENRRRPCGRGRQDSGKRASLSLRRIIVIFGVPQPYRTSTTGKRVTVAVRCHTGTELERRDSESAAVPGLGAPGPGPTKPLKSDSESESIAVVTLPESS
jgi:hypothetical protein